MSKTIEVYLDAWGIVKRRELALLKNPNFAQARYEIVPAGGVNPYRDTDSVVVPTDCGRGFIVSMEEVDLASRVIAKIGDFDADYRKVIEARYLLIASKEDRAASIGFSPAKFSRDLRDAKHAFGAVWYGIRNKVVQRGVMMKFEYFEESC